MEQGHASVKEKMLARMAQDIASYLTDEWRASEYRETSFHLSGPDGMKLIFWIGGYDLDDLENEKFEAWGEFPEGTFVLKSKEPARINVSYKRGAQAIAKDVERRYLSKYVPLYYEKLKEQGEHRAYAAAHERVLTTLAETFGGEVGLDRDGKPDHVVVGKRYGSDRPNGKVNASNSLIPDTKEREGWMVHLDLRRVPIALALEIGNLIADPQLRPF